MKFNEWLISTNFVAQISYENKMYMNKLFKRVYDLLKELPVPIISSYDPKQNQIYFMFVTHKKSFTIDEDINIEDYVTLVKRWAIQFFPTYTISTKEWVPLSSDEVFEKVKKDKIPIEEAVDLKKEVDIIEIGVIESIYLTDDLFRININDKFYIKKSHVMRLSDFKGKLKNITNDQEKRDFIFENSIEVKDEGLLEIIFSKAPYFKNMENRVIKFKGKKMFNFFSINYPTLKGVSIEKLSELVYQWGQYKIYFENEEMELDCLEYLQQKRDKDNITFNVV